MEREKLIAIAERWLAGTASEKDLQELHQWYDRWSDDEEHVTDSPDDREAVRLRILARIREQMPEVKRPSRKISFYMRYGRQVAAAAVIALLAAAGGFFFYQYKTVQIPVAHDVKAPETNRATITLANGQQVDVDDAGSGRLAMQGSVELIKLADGEIAYQIPDQTISQPAIYNTFTNPRGSQVAAIILSDRTKVWLNVGSSLTYPVAFTGRQRNVKITGEAYFEVSENAAMPFVVSANDLAEIKVLGTHFNVNAYPDEHTVKATLFEGSVQVSPPIRSSGKPVILEPGQQASLAKAGMMEITEADLEAAVDWKNGLFLFNNTDIETVMQEIARWYDVEVVYESKPSKRFRGGIPRNMSAANVFRVLEQTGGVHFKIEGDKIIVNR